MRFELAGHQPVMRFVKVKKDESTSITINLDSK